MVGVAVKLATGTIALLPVRVLVEPPPLAVAKLTLLVNPPVATGAKRTVTFVEPPGAMLNAARTRLAMATIPSWRMKVTSLLIVMPTLTWKPGASEGLLK